MVIGIYVNTLPTTVFIDRLLHAMVAKGHQVLVFGTELSSFKRVEGVKYVFYKLHSRLNISKLFYFLKYNFLLSLFLRKEKQVFDALLRKEKRLNTHNKTQYYPILWHKPDVLHVQWIKGIEQFLWVRKHGIKLAASLRGSHVYFTPLIENEIAEKYKSVFPELDGVHAVCKDLLQSAVPYHLNKNKAEVIYSGLHLADLPFQLPSSRKKRTSEMVNILSIGRVSWMKGYDIAIDAMKLLADHQVQFTYTIIGGKPNEELLYQIDDLGLQEKVFFEAWHSFEQIVKIISKADVLLVASVSEGIANTAIEAMAVGTPVISTDCGGMAELIRHNENGFLVSNRDTKAIANAVIKIAAMDDQDLDALAIKARKKIDSDFDMHNNAEQFEQFYLNLLRN